MSIVIIKGSVGRNIVGVHDNSRVWKKISYSITQGKIQEPKSFIQADGNIGVANDFILV